MLTGNHPLQVALVLWRGDIGGAELLYSRLAEQMGRQGVEATVVMIGPPRPLSDRLIAMGVPMHALGFQRGRHVLWHPRLYAREVGRFGRDGAILGDRGYISATLRAGGYRAPIVGVEHGSLLLDEHKLNKKRLFSRAGRWAGARLTDAEVAVSEYMRAKVQRHSHASDVRLIYNGIDTTQYCVTENAKSTSSEVVVGFAGRLVAEKGVGDLIGAVAVARRRTPVRLRIAGDGGERAHLESMAAKLGIHDAVEFVGSVDDIADFWQHCHIAVLASRAFESFSMVTLEAMSCARPVVATNVGAIPELVVHGTTGVLVAPSHVEQLAEAIVTYAEDDALRTIHGEAGRARAVKLFDIQRCARAYIELVVELTARRRVESGL